MGQDTWIQFYDAELLRLRAHTLDDEDERHRHFRSAIELAQKQGAHIFELRAAADDCEPRGRAGACVLARGFRSHAHRPDVAGIGPRASFAGGDEESLAEWPSSVGGMAGPERGVAAERGRLARPLRVDHRLSTRVASWRQGGVESRAARAHRRARPTRLAGLLRTTRSR